MAEPLSSDQPLWGLLARLAQERLGFRHSVRKAPDPSVQPDLFPEETPAEAVSEAIPPQVEPEPQPELESTRSYRIIGAQQIGRGKAECQDAFGSDILDETFVVCIADGAGSAPRSREGAQRAITAVLDYLQYDTQGRANDRLRNAFEAAHNAVVAAAEEEDLPAKDFKTTLAIAIGDHRKVVAAHVGDSLVVISDGKGIRPLLRPKNGEFGNTTFFITSEDYEDHLQFAESEGLWKGLALQTDGLEAVTYWKQRDDLEAATYQALFSILDRQSEVRAQQELDLFVSEDAIMDKCNDDLTLLCVVPISIDADPRATDCSESAEPDRDRATASESS